MSEGTDVVSRACSTIESIVASSHQLDLLLTDVSSNAQEQRVGVSRIGQSLIQLDQMTQNNAVLVNQTASATSAMRNQAHALVNQVARYQLVRHRLAATPES